MTHLFPKTIAALAGVVCLSACGSTSDAPVAGDETFVPVSNQAVHVRISPYADYHWLYPTRPDPSPAGPERRYFKR